MAATLFWKLSDKEFIQDNLDKDLKRIIKSNTYNISNLFDGSPTVESFLNLFFPKIETTCFVANLSLQDKSDREIKLAIRIPNHGYFSDYMDEQSSFAVIGHWQTGTRSPWFFPEKIIVTHNDNEPTTYEHELICEFEELARNEYPNKTKVNVLTEQLASSLPMYAVEASTRLADWQSFLNFKRNLIREKTVGLRYISFSYNPDNFQLDLIVVTENRDYLDRAIRAFARQNLQLFDTNISTNDWQFILPTDDRNQKRTPKADLELGQLPRNKNKFLQIITKDNENYSRIKKLAEEYEVPFKNPVFAKLSVDINEEWKNKLDKIDLTATDIDTQFDNKEILDNFTDKIPAFGFLSFSMVGDWALINRQERTIKNLRQNENCYSPYLSSYLFDITQAKTPASLEEVENWHNPNLNEAQKSAVRKMLSAPDLCLIQGPPGTGKTTVIAEAILQFAQRQKTILLASQAHDAIDNALSRIVNHPELRAIRLAKESKGRSKITEDGQQFSGDQALARYYDALGQYIQTAYLEPLKSQEEQKNALQTWIEEAKFLALDMQNIATDRQSIAQQGQLLKQELAKAKNTYEELSKIYDAQQESNQKLEQLCGFLKRTSPAPVNIELPIELHEIAQALFNIQKAKVKIPFTSEDFKNNSASQMLIFNALFDEWHKIETSIPTIKKDIERLNNAGEGGLVNVETKVKIQSLTDEIQVLTDRMEVEESNELINEWRAKRRELNLLKSASDGLTAECYQMFEDADRLSVITNSSQITQGLQKRVEFFEKIQQNISTKIEQIIINWQNTISINQISLPSRDNIDSLEQELSSLRDDYKTLREKERVKQQALQDHLARQNFMQDFDKSLQAAEEQVERLVFQNEQTKLANKQWLPLFKKWIELLNQSGQDKQDWEQLKEVYTENCNLVAISCNEDERTLTNAGLNGFDVVIIDEVSKATPLELLLPLMRGRKAILVGDHRQLPPLFQESQDSSLTLEDIVEEETEEGRSDTLLTEANFRRYEKMVTASLFKELFEKAPDILRERLTVQFRMHPDIMRMINYFYEGQLQCGNPDADRTHHVILKNRLNTLVDENQHLLWIDTSYDEKGATCVDMEGSTNPAEARMIAQTLVNLNEQMKNKGFNARNKHKVGVVSFYQSQCRTIRDEIKKLTKEGIKFEAIDVEINTVIRYQGKEKSIILISLVRNDGGSKDKRRSSNANVARFEFINVAMSRAQNLLMVFGARNMLEMRDIKLPRMDSAGQDKKKVYKDMFNKLDIDARICTAREFAQALEYKPDTVSA